MDKPRISVITVCFNSKDHIEEAIQSVISQDYDNYEYIIVDGGSTDGTLGIIEKYRENITKLISEPDKGISDAFNKGIKMADGEVVCIVNSDDIMPDTALIRFAEQFEEGIDVFRGEEIIRNFSSGKQRVMKPTLKYSRIPIFFNMCHMATYIRRDAYERYGFYDVNFKYIMDKELIFRFHRQGATEKRIKGVFGIFRLGGVSQNISKRKREEAEEIIRRAGGTGIELLIYGLYTDMKSYIGKVVKGLRR